MSARSEPTSSPAACSSGSAAGPGGGSPWGGPGGALKWVWGGPGGCFLWASPEMSERHAPALTGWLAHARPFAFEPEMDFAGGAWRWLGGTPAIPALYAATEGPR